MSLRFIALLGFLIGGCLALDARSKHEKRLKAHADLADDLTTWEGEGGNLPPRAKPIETSLATSAP